uniref:Putative LRR receptor-like serine/threonine-protein kinase n=1 Tax=Noccaea caerulescens TaxID=107243 RepID=A0A1J3J8Q2_NOCCA
MKSLLLINLSGNNLSGSVPHILAQKKGMSLNVEGNPLMICAIGSCVNKKGKIDRTKDIVVPVTRAVVVASIALLICALLLFFHFRHKRSPAVVEGPPSNMQDPDDALCFFQCY